MRLIHPPSLFHLKYFSPKCFIFTKDFSAFAISTAQCSNASVTIGAATTNRSFNRSVHFFNLPPLIQNADAKQNPSQSIASQSGPKQGGWGWSLSQYYLNFHLPFPHTTGPSMAPSNLYRFSIFNTAEITALDFVVIHGVLGFVQVNCSSVHRSIFSFDATLHWRHENVIDNMKV